MQAGGGELHRPPAFYLGGPKTQATRRVLVFMVCRGVVRQGANCLAWGVMSLDLGGRQGGLPGFGTQGILPQNHFSGHGRNPLSALESLHYAGTDGGRSHLSLAWLYPAGASIQ